MYIEHIQRAFAKMGAELHVEIAKVDPYQRIRNRHNRRENRWRSRAIPERLYAMDIVERPGKAYYQLQVQYNELRPLEFQVVDLRPKRRHLLLMAKSASAGLKDKLLCGHDERHWFISAINPGATNVEQAMESLKPAKVLDSQRQHKVKRKNWHKRHNSGFIRQGEWFFLPLPAFQPARGTTILRNEPFRRVGGSKPHIIEEVIRTGGEMVYVSRRFPQGLTSIQYQKRLQQSPHLKYENWQLMRRNPKVFVRGKVRHADHKTIVLPCWHEIVINQEETNGRVDFFD